jgi:hypothetical protein
MAKRRTKQAKRKIAAKRVPTPSLESSPTLNGSLVSLPEVKITEPTSSASKATSTQSSSSLSLSRYLGFNQKLVVTDVVASLAVAVLLIAAIIGSVLVIK